VAERDWVGWHEAYDQRGSSMERRLRVVQRRIAEGLDHAPPGPLRIISMCAGQGRDLLGVLAHHPRRGDVTARLVELNVANAARASEVARSTGLDRVEVVCGDASVTTAYEDAVPADLVLVCGVFGNVSDRDVAHTVEALPRLCGDGATVIWTRHRLPPDLTPTIRTWFEDAGFDEVAFDGEDGYSFGVGTNRLTVPPLRFVPDLKLFDFVGDGSGAQV
jgi:hypothetical protein